jgi:type IV pilus assembly protein PilB
VRSPNWAVPLAWATLPPMPTPRLRLGQLLVDAKMITQEALEETLAAQRADGRRLGTLLVERSLINETQLTQILSHQLSVPWVSLLHIEFSRQLLNLVPREVAERYCLVPIYVRHVRNQGETLYVAMDDPTNDEGLRECMSHSGLPVRAMIAPPEDIRSAIRVYYRTSQAKVAAVVPAAAPAEVEVRAKPITEPPAAPVETVPAPVDAVAVPVDAATAPPDSPLAPLDQPPSTPPVDAPPLVPQPTADAAFAAAEVAPDAVVIPTPPLPVSEAPTIEAVEIALSGRMPFAVPPPIREPVGQDAPPEEEVDRIPQPRGRAPRMVSLTLLDGTTITLPARGKKRPAGEEPPRRPSRPAPPAGEGLRRSEPPTGEGLRPSEPPSDEEPGLTARDLVAALRAVSHGTDASEILGNNVRWEAMFAALLSLLLKKHLIADWEFVDELKKI